MMKQEVLTIHVHCTDCLQVNGAAEEKHMVLFTGSADHPNFRGEILPGACDTQTRIGDVVSLSARYMLKGVDCAGEACVLFIENTGSMVLPSKDPVIYTAPKVVTDSTALAWMETSELSGSVTPMGENQLVIRIFAKD